MVLNPQSELNYLYLSLKAAAPFFSQSAVLTASARTVIIFSPSCSFDCRNSADRKSKTSTIIEINLLFLFFFSSFPYFHFLCGRKKRVERPRRGRPYTCQMWVFCVVVAPIVMSRHSRSTGTIEQFTNLDCPAGALPLRYLRLPPLLAGPP